MQTGSEEAPVPQDETQSEGNMGAKHKPLIPHNPSVCETTQGNPS